jgi:hypothetical protein
MHLYVSVKGEWWFVVRVDICLSSLIASGVRWVWAVSATPQPLYPVKESRFHSTGG